MEEQCSQAVETKTSSAYIKTLQAYKNLTDDPVNHYRLLKDKTVLLLIAYLLDTRNDEILQLCLDILLDFVIDCNSKSQEIMLGMLGLVEGLHALRARKLQSSSLQKVSFILNHLQCPKQSNLRSRQITARKYKLYNVYLRDLNQESKKDYEDILLTIKGIVSFVIDLESNCCLIRIFGTSTIKDIVQCISDRTESIPMLVIFNQKGNKEYVDPYDTSAQSLEYEDPKSSFVEAPVNFFKHTFVETKKRVKGFLGTLDDYFYW